MGLLSALDVTSPRRRLFRFAFPGPQLRLALCLLVITVLFAALFALNSYAAYGSIMEAALSIVPEGLRSDLSVQTAHYGSVTIALLLGYLLAVVGLSGASVHWLTGATVALERHVRALNAGQYGSRVKLREGDAVHAELARQLNALAAKLQREHDQL